MTFWWLCHGLDNQLSCHYIWLYCDNNILNFTIKFIYLVIICIHKTRILCDYRIVLKAMIISTINWITVLKKFVSLSETNELMWLVSLICNTDENNNTASWINFKIWKCLKLKWCKLPWRNRLARSTVNRKVAGSSPAGSDSFVTPRIFLLIIQW